MNINSNIDMQSITDLMSCKNHISIQLFDNVTKEKINEINTHNLVNNSVARNAFISWFIYGIQNSFSSNIHTTINNVIIPFNYLILTNTDIEENPDLKFVYGDIIGYVDKQIVYSGPDTLLGTLNVYESNYTNTRLHYVFDFPTHAANGTFNTLWWASDKGNFLLDSNYGIYNFVQNQNASISFYNNVAYSLFENNIKVCNIVNGNFLEQNSIQVDNNQTELKSLFVNSDGIWLISSESSRSIGLYILNGSTLGNRIDLSQYISTFNNYNIGGFCIKDNSVYIQIINTDENESFIYKVNLNDLNYVYCTVPANNGIIMTLSLYDEYILASSGDDLDVNGSILFDANLKIVNSQFKRSQSSTLMNAACDPISNWMVGTHYSCGSYDLNACSIAPPGTQSKLNSPITKTNEYTMKIIYDINFQDLSQFILAPNGSDVGSGCGSSCGSGCGSSCGSGCGSIG